MPLQLGVINDHGMILELAQQNMNAHERYLGGEAPQNNKNAEAIKSRLQSERYAILLYCAIYWHSHCSSANSDHALTQMILRFVRTRQSHEFFLVPKVLGISNLHRSNF